MLFVIFWNTCGWKNMWKNVYCFLKTENNNFNLFTSRISQYWESLLYIYYIHYLSLCRPYPHNTVMESTYWDLHVKREITHVQNVLDNYCRVACCCFKIHFYKLSSKIERKSLLTLRVSLTFSHYLDVLWWVGPVKHGLKCYVIKKKIHHVSTVCFSPLTRGWTLHMGFIFMWEGDTCIRCIMYHLVNNIWKSKWIIFWCLHDSIWSCIACHYWKLDKNVKSETHGQDTPGWSNQPKFKTALLARRCCKLQHNFSFIILIKETKV